MKKYIPLALLVLIFLVGFAEQTNHEVYIKPNKIEAIELVLVDDYTEFMPGDPPAMVKVMIVYGISGNEYELTQADSQFYELLEKYFSN